MLDTSNHIRDFVPPPPRQNILSVSDFINITNNCISNFGKAVVQGEVSECRLYNHLYFKIKDEDSCLECIMFAGALSRLNFQIEVGMQIVLQGTSSIYAKTGQYRFIAESASLAGRGLIMERLMRLKEMLKQEGVFDKLKRPIPNFVRKVGIITSKEGHVLHDILSTLYRRNPLIEVVLYDAKVQGAEAPISLMEALNLAYNNNEVDVLIIGRGGGSFEDLLAFSDEAVVRLIAKSPIPIISAVGHEPDISLSDFAADQRAATPTAAAEMVSFVTLSMMLERIYSLYERIENSLFSQLDRLTINLEKLRLRIEKSSPDKYISHNKIVLLNLVNRLNNAMQQRYNLTAARFNALKTKVHSLDPLHQIQRSKERLANIRYRIDLALDHKLNSCKQRLNYAYHSIEQSNSHKLNETNKRLLNLKYIFKSSSLFERMAKLEQRLNVLRAKIITLNPLAVLERGYSYTTELSSNASIKDDLEVGARIKTKLQHMEIISVVEIIDRVD